MESMKLLPNAWPEYQLIDSGEKEKLEQFGNILLIRPEPQALWHKSQPELWKNVHARYRRSTQGGGSWQIYQPIPDNWQIKWRNNIFLLKLTGFKHVGIFPEQLIHWEWLEQKLRSAHQSATPKILNLFGYTGASSIVAAQLGAQVTHVDASKDVVTWARQNAGVSGLSDAPIRWIVDDVVKFVKRELKRGNRYDGILLDPPKFGRGAQKEVWKIENDSILLLNLCKQLLSDSALFLVMNTYTTEISHQSFYNIFQQLAFADGKIESGELLIQSKLGKICLPTSIFVRWSS